MREVLQSISVSTSSYSCIADQSLSVASTNLVFRGYQDKYPWCPLGSPGVAETSEQLAGQAVMNKAMGCLAAKAAAATGAHNQL